jgi:hypothetical protein
MCVLGFGLSAATAWAAFATPTTSAGNEYRAAPDWVAPSAARSVVEKSQGGIPGYIRPGGGYRVLAQVTDSGNPSSGITSVIADGGEGPQALSSGTIFTVGGLDYNYRSALVTTSAVPEGVYPYTLASTDGVGNSRLQSGFSATVDNTAASATGVQAANKAGGILGRPEIGDTATLTFNDTIDPISVISGWNGALTDVVVRIDNNVAAQGGFDAMTIYNASNSAALPLGTVRLARTDYVTANSTFGVTGTTSKLTLSGGVATVQLGTAAGTPTTAAGTGSMTWFPASAAYDRAGNPTSTTSTTETGTVDVEF